jgi:hypothetical protein
MNPKLRPLRNALSLMAALLLGACLGGQTGGETGADSPTEDETQYAGAGCEEEVTPLAADEVSALGFSAADVALLVGESVTTPMVWLDTTDLGVQATVEPGPSELTITILDSTDPRFVDASPKEPEDGAAIEPAADCPDRVDVDVTLHITTADGALDETVSTTLHATSAELVDLVVPLDPTSLTGTFRATLVSSTAELQNFALHTTYDSTGTNGELSATLTETDGEVAMATMVRFAEWNVE